MNFDSKTVVFWWGDGKIVPIANKKIWGCAATRFAQIPHSSNSDLHIQCKASYVFYEHFCISRPTPSLLNLNNTVNGVVMMVIAVPELHRYQKNNNKPVPRVLYFWSWISQCNGLDRVHIRQYFLSRRNDTDLFNIRIALINDFTLSIIYC